MPEESKLICPRCGSELVICIANGKHCNQCGNDFDVLTNPIGRIQAYPWSGWKRPEK